MILEVPPQKVNFAIQIISGIFPGEWIIVEHGKIAIRGAWALVWNFESVGVKLHRATRPRLFKLTLSLIGAFMP